jgi:hypothetical protein
VDVLPDGTVVGQEFRGVLIDNAAIIGGSWSLQQTRIDQWYYQLRGLPAPASRPAATRATTWTIRAPFRTHGHWVLYGTDNWSMPLWLAALIFGVLPAIHLVRWYRRRRARRADRSVCQACGYDLRATPERCPECGTVPAGGT